MNIERDAQKSPPQSEIRKLIEGDSENKLNMDDLEKEAPRAQRGGREARKETGYRAYAQRWRGSGLSRWPL